MSNLPAGWALTTIGTVCDIRTGKTPPTGNRENFSTDIPFFKPGDLGRADALDTSEYSISHIGAEVAGYLPKHTVLVSCIGNLGKVGILAVAGSCNQQINAILPSPKIEPRFILYWAKQLRPWLEENASATTISIVNKGRFEKAPLPLPPLDEQRRIVAMLDSLLRSSKAACEELDHIPKLVERYKKAVLAAAFRGEITAAWRTENNRPVPADWPTRTLGDLALDIRYGTAAKCHYEPKATPVLRIPNVAAGKIDIGDLKYGAFEASDIKKLSLKRGDLLVVRSNGASIWWER
jgi:type I restriction enzyme, S subunit